MVVEVEVQDWATMLCGAVAWYIIVSFRGRRWEGGGGDGELESSGAGFWLAGRQVELRDQSFWVLGCWGSGRPLAGGVSAERLHFWRGPQESKLQGLKREQDLAGPWQDLARPGCSPSG